MEKNNCSYDTSFNFEYCGSRVFLHVVRRSLFEFTPAKSYYWEIRSSLRGGFFFSVWVLHWICLYGTCTATLLWFFRMGKIYQIIVATRWICSSQWCKPWFTWKTRKSRNPRESYKNFSNSIFRRITKAPGYKLRLRIRFSILCVFNRKYPFTSPGLYVLCRNFVNFVFGRCVVVKNINWAKTFFPRH